MTLAREDLASGALQGVVRAARFADPTPMQVSAPSAWMFASPDPAAEHVNQLLFGEVFDVLETVGQFGWGQARRDGYVGFVELHAIAPDLLSPSHWIAARSTFAFAEPAVRAKPFGPMAMNALCRVEASECAFSKDNAAGWTPTAHLRAIGSFHRDHAGVAESLLGAPYLWGGRDCAGLDCSGLIQAALQACGVAAPRDADQQAALGVELAAGELRRGDLVAWRGHIGVMLDAERLLHANAYHMAVACEPLSSAVARIAAGGTGQPTAYRRLDSI